MLRRSLFVSALMLAGVVGFASSAKAADYNINNTFTAAVDATCNLTTPTQGSLAGILKPDAAKKVLSNAGGTPAYVGVYCSGGTLKGGTPTLTSKPTSFTGTPVNTAKITLGANSTTDTETTGITAGTTPSDAMIDMTSTLSTGTFDAGSYTYTVVVTATLP